LKIIGKTAKRCSTCGISWPSKYSRCYQCGGPVDRIPREPTITDEEAESMKNHYEFDRYLEKEGRT
jgi:hypothetical protein